MDTVRGFILTISLKKVNIKLDAFERIESFKEKCISIFSERLKCIVLTGSFAKGDYNQSSDIDVWVIMNKFTTDDLFKICDIIKEIPGINEMNVQSTDIDEIKSKPFRRELNPIQLYLDGVIVFGNLPEYNPYYSEIRNYILSICVQVIMSSRHYITADESEESLSKGRLLKYVVKPLSWVLRYKSYIKTGIFPRTFPDLERGLNDEHEIKLIKIYEEMLIGKFKGSYKNVNLECINCAESILT